MWYLKSTHDGAIHKLLLGEQYKVNRKGGDLVLPQDQSISRAHAIIEITDAGEVFVSDEGSKYGTYVNEGIVQTAKLEPNQRHRIKKGDKVRFGLQWNVWQLHKQYITVCTSTISGEEKSKLMSVLKRIGVNLRSDWDSSCTHLIMNVVSLTRKVVCALACAKPVTTVEYWMQFEAAITNQTELPKEKDYQPPVGEEQLQKEKGSIVPNEERKTLFREKVFVFSSEESKMRNKDMVEYAGGRCDSENNPKISPELCCAPNYILVLVGEKIQDGSKFKAFLSAVWGKGWRPVAASEIGLAIYTGSIEKYCNPTFRRRNILGGSPSTQSQMLRGACLAENTEDIPIESQDIRQEEAKRGIVIPPSFPSCQSRDIESCKSRKRAPSTSGSDKQSPKPKSNQWLDKSQMIRTATDATDFSAATVLSRRPSSPRAKDASGHDTIDLDTQKTGKQSPEKARGGKTSAIDTSLFEDPFKEPIGVRTSTQKSRICFDEDKNEAPTKGTRTSTRNRQVDDDPFALPSTSRTRRQANDDGDEDMFALPSTSRTRRQAHDDGDEDMFAFPSTSGARKSTKRRQTDDDDDPFALPATSGAKELTELKNPSKKPKQTVASKSSRNQRINDADDNLFALPLSPKRVNAEEEAVDETLKSLFSDIGNSPQSRKSAPGRSGERSDPQPTNDESRKRKATNQPTDENRSKKRNESDQALSTNGKHSFRITLADFLDKTHCHFVKVEKKEEYDEDDPYEKNLCDVITKISIEETSLMRPRRVVVQESHRDTPVFDGRPNFKRFKKVLPLHGGRGRCISFVVETLNGTLVSDNPDDPAPISTSRPADSQQSTLDDLFPRVRRQNQREKRCQEIDEWALPL